MKVLLDIKEKNATHLLEVLKSLPYVKVMKISEEKAILIEEVKEAVEELNLIKKGLKKGRSASELLNEL